MYKESLSLTFKMSKLVFAMLAIFLVYYALVEKNIWGFSGGSGGDFFIFVIVAFYAHYLCIFSTLTVPKDEGRKLFGFMGWSIFLSLLTLIPAGVLSAIFYHGIGLENSLQDETGLGVFLTIFVASYGVCGLLIYSFFGTVLPAHVAGREKGLSKAYMRGEKNFLSIFWQLLAGPGSILIISLVAYTVVLTVGIVPENLFADGWVPNITTFLAEGILLWVQFWATIMVAWVLSTAFLNSEKSEEAVPPEMAAN